MMKKLLIFFIAAFLFASYVNAQSFELSYDGNILSDTVYVYDNPDSTYIAFYAHVKNISDKPITVNVARTNIIEMEGSSNSVCFAEQCYSPLLDTCTTYLDLQAGEISSELTYLKAEYYHSGGIIGETVVRYSFYNVNQPTDHKDVVVVYWTSPTSVEETIFSQISFSNIYPNPATSNINIDYNFDTNINNASLKIVNLLGSVVKELEIDQNSNKLSMDISNLDAGVYFYSIVVNNEVFQTKKLVIR